MRVSTTPSSGALTASNTFRAAATCSSAVLPYCTSRMTPSDRAATNEERKAAYGRAQKELDGLIVLPAVTRASIERKIAGEIEA